MDLTNSQFLKVMSNHRKWCYEENFGVTYFGIPSNLLKLSNVRFDILHLKLLIIKKIITFIRSFLIKNNNEAREKFSKILDKVWGKFYLDYYDINKNLNVLHSEHINSFIISLIVPVIKFFKEEIKQTEVTIQLQLLLESWQQLTQIMSKVIYKDKEEYYQCLTDFYYNIIIFK